MTSAVTKTLTSPEQLTPAQLSLITETKTWKHLWNIDQRGKLVFRIVSGSIIAVGLYFLNEFLTVRFTFAAFISKIDKALKTTGNPLGGNFSGTSIAMAFVSPVYNYLKFGNAPSFATAVGYSFYTQEFASDFALNMPDKLYQLYEQARLNPQWSPLQLVCTTFGRANGDAACQTMCHPPAPANTLNAIGFASSYAMNGFFIAGNPIGLLVGGVVGLGLYYAQANSKYQKCLVTQNTCIATKETECKLWSDS